MIIEARIETYRRWGGAVFVAVLAICLATACGPFRSYGARMQAYLDSFATRDYEAVEANMCSAAQERIRASGATWDEIHAAEVDRVGDLGDATFKRARGSQELARFAITTGSTTSWYELPVADEDGKLWPCPTDLMILGSPSPPSPRFFGLN